jgi:hypothetical protein
MHLQENFEREVEDKSVHFVSLRNKLHNQNIAKHITASLFDPFRPRGNCERFSLSTALRLITKKSVSITKFKHILFIPKNYRYFQHNSRACRCICHVLAGL